MSVVPRPYSIAEMSRRVLVTSSFPYASGPLQLGQLVDALQADIHTRFLKLVGREAVYICAADSHGTEVMMSARAAGEDPETLARRYCEDHLRDFDAMHIEFSAFSSTDDEANRELSALVFNRLREKGYIYEKEIPLDYCGSCRRFLPDRFDRGRCPGCGARVRSSGLCQECSGAPLAEPSCPLCGGTPGERLSRHYFFRLSEFSGRLGSWIRAGGGLQPSVEQRVGEWLRDGLDDWCISRDGPYFGFPVPGELKKFFCVWLDAPLGYLSGVGRLGGGHGRSFWQDGAGEIIQFIRRDIIAFHTLFWPAMLMGADFSLPDRIVTQGFLSLDGQRMAGRHGPQVAVREIPAHLDPESFRFATACQLENGLGEIDISADRVAALVNNRLDRILRFLRRAFGGESRSGGAAPEALLRIYTEVGRAHAALDLRQAMARVQDLVAAAEELGGDAVSPATGRDVTILLKPVLPQLGRELESMLGASRPWTWNNLGTPFAGRAAGAVADLGKRLACCGTEKQVLRADVSRSCADR